MKWTKRVPAKQGWYWRRQYTEGAFVSIEIIFLSFNRENILVQSCAHEDNSNWFNPSLHDEYSGPIPLPRECGQQ